MRPFDMPMAKFAMTQDSEQDRRVKDLLKQRFDVRRKLLELDRKRAQTRMTKLEEQLAALGENTDEARQKFREELTETHDLFKHFVATYRPQLDLAQVATGEHWYGTRALELGLVDAIGTSDDWLMAASREAKVLELRVRSPRSLGDRLGMAAADAGERLLERMVRRPLP